MIVMQRLLKELSSEFDGKVHSGMFSPAGYGEKFNFGDSVECLSRRSIDGYPGSVSLGMRVLKGAWAKLTSGGHAQGKRCKGAISSSWLFAFILRQSPFSLLENKTKQKGPLRAL